MCMSGVHMSVPRGSKAGSVNAMIHLSRRALWGEATGPYAVGLPGQGLVAKPAPTPWTAMMQGVSLPLKSASSCDSAFIWQEFASTLKSESRLPYNANIAVPELTPVSLFNRCTGAGCLVWSKLMTTPSRDKSCCAPKHKLRQVGRVVHCAGMP